jgi:hypothetical protein
MNFLEIFSFIALLCFIENSEQGNNAGIYNSPSIGMHIISLNS